MAPFGEGGVGDGGQQFGPSGFDAEVVEIDVPSFFVRVVAAATGEGGHSTRIRASQARDQSLDFEPALVSGLYPLVQYNA
ncbi:hypothetical protein ABIB83_009103 [Bradyrhizobium sp. I1.8.5]|uniref:hypothetical protein n=1 Tax=Bradyrhizobium sp. I1.8.5 TaxID=3156365 RepID=UPI003396C8B2